MTDLYSVKVSEIWEFVKEQDVLFWLINIYLFFEYVRPQTLYPAIAVLPYSQIVLLMMCCLLFLRSELKLLSHPSDKLLWLFFLVAVLSSIFALSPQASFEKLPVLISWIIVYYCIVNIINTEKRFIVFVLAFLLYSFKMAQHSFIGWFNIGFAFSSWGTGGGPGYFHNSGEFGIQMCIFMSISVYFFIALNEHWPSWKKTLFIFFPLTALTGTISSSSRGALVGAVAVLLWMLLKSRYKIKGLLMLAIIAGLMLFLIPTKQIERFRQAGEDRTSINRLERWEKGLEMASRYPMLGVGLDNWQVADRQMFDGDGSLSHNIFIECVSELGRAGLVIYVLLILSVFACNHRTRKLVRLAESENRFIFYMAHGLDGALVGYLVSGFFVTVLYYPYFWINLAMTVSLNSLAINRCLTEPDVACRKKATVAGRFEKTSTGRSI